MITQYKDGRDEIIKADSLTEYMMLRPSEQNKYADPKRYSEHSARWFGVDGGVKAVNEVISNAWPEGRKKALKLLRDISADIPQAQSIKRRRTFGDQGDAIDMQKVYAGQLDTAWETTTKRLSNARGRNVVKIKTSFGGNCSKSPEDLFYKGVVAAILTDVLEDAGYRIELEAYNHGVKTYTDGGGDYAVFPVKAADEPLDIGRLVSITAFAGFFRVYGFNGILAPKKRATSALGHRIEQPRTLKGEEADDQNAIILNNIYSREAAISKIKEVLKDFNE